MTYSPLQWLENNGGGAEPFLSGFPSGADISEATVMSTSVATLKEIDSFLVCLSHRFQRWDPEDLSGWGHPTPPLISHREWRWRDCLGELISLSLIHANLSALDPVFCIMVPQACTVYSGAMESSRLFSICPGSISNAHIWWWSRQRPTTLFTIGTERNNLITRDQWALGEESIELAVGLGSVDRLYLKTETMFRLQAEDSHPSLLQATSSALLAP